MLAAKDDPMIAGADLTLCCNDSPHTWSGLSGCDVVSYVLEQPGFDEFRHRAYFWVDPFNTQVVEEDNVDDLP